MDHKNSVNMQKKNQERIGIFGGTFDPPHLGHLELATMAQKQLGLLKVIWVLTGRSPFKINHHLTDEKLRLEMLQSLLSKSLNHEISFVELNRPAPHYTSETLQILHQQFPNKQLYFIMGSDSLRALSRWNQPQKIVDLCEFAVWKRPGFEMEVDFKSKNTFLDFSKLHWLNAPSKLISSSEIRKRFQNGLSCEKLITSTVNQLIKSHQLYL